MLRRRSLLEYRILYTSHRGLWRAAFVAALLSLPAACGGAGTSSAPGPSGSGNPSATPPPQAIAGAATPSSVSVVTATNANSARPGRSIFSGGSMRSLTFARARSLAAALALVPAAQAAPGPTSPYATDLQTSHVEDATSRGIGEVNMIACVMSALRPDALVNQGDYVALVDKNKCDSEKRSSSGNSGSNSDGAQAPAYITAVVNSARASNNDPMIVKTW